MIEKKQNTATMDRHRRPLRRTNACGLFSAAVGVLATIAVASWPRASAFTIVLGSFQNSSLWRERYASDGGAHRQHQPDYYDVLGVRTNASKEDIKTAFRRLVKAYHPDANPTKDTTAQFRAINKAYETLSDASMRQRYDNQLYNKGCSDDTPSFVIGGEEFRQPMRSTSETPTELYRTISLEPNESFNGSLFDAGNNNKNDNQKNEMFRIRTM